MLPEELRLEPEFRQKYSGDKWFATALPDAVDTLIQMATRDPALNVVVDLVELRTTAGSHTFPISLPAAARDGFLDGTWDATGLLLDRYEEVEAVAARLPYVGR